MTSTTSTTPAAPCSPEQFYCSKDFRCVPLSWRCDGERDCRSGFDELGCPVRPVRVNSTGLANSRNCSTEQFHCDNRCIPLRWKCDGDWDCRSGEDELGCSPPINVTTTASPSTAETNVTLEVCSRHQFQCDNGRCISNVFQCDEDDDCLDGSDEKHCREAVPTEAPTCSPFFWKCASGQCIYHKFRCDDDLDCTDGSDEINCALSTEDEDNFILNNLARRRKPRGRGRSRRRRD